MIFPNAVLTFFVIATKKVTKKNLEFSRREPKRTNVVVNASSRYLHTHPAVFSGHHAWNIICLIIAHFVLITAFKGLSKS
jgi:hypothetical protein